MAKYLGLILCIFLLGSCAFIDQNLKVNPTVNYVSSTVGNGKKVGVRVVDERTDQFIGKRMTGYGYGAAKITTDQDLVAVLKDAILRGLQAKGFETTEFDQSPANARVELRSLQYDASIGLWTGGNIGKAAIKIVATNSLGKTYEMTYRGQKEIRTAFVGSQETNTNVVNGALTEAIEEIFLDEKLLNFLAN